MNAGGTHLRILLDHTIQYTVPLFQRTYSWDKNNWETLWNDLLETCEAEDGSRHFLGSIVTKSLSSTPEGVSRFLLIDGQQRLTTLTLLLAALRDSAQASEPKFAEKISDRYLTNRHESGTERHKLLPTQADRESYGAVMDGASPGLNSALIQQAYAFFLGQLKNLKADPSSPDRAKLEHVILDAFELVSITLGDNDNEYRIFESLNAKGEPLSQSDLLRNYLFMRLPVEEQEGIYRRRWLPLQQNLEENLDDFFRYEQMKDGSFVREGDVYQEWRKTLERLSLPELRGKIDELSHDGAFYHRLVAPEHEPNAQIAAALRRLNQFGGQTVYPFLLNVFRWRDQGEIDDAGLLEILGMIESFLVRRLFCGIRTGALNRLFNRLAVQLPNDLGRIEAVQRTLSDPGRRWPRDDEFRQGLLLHKLYRDSRADQRRMILERLEMDCAHKEAPTLSNTSIEHVMPQTLSPAWKHALGPEAESDHEAVLHVLGNLTLSAYNSELGNDPFDKKRERFAMSNVELNKEIAKEIAWTRTEIESRGQRLADRAIRIWPGPLDLRKASTLAASADITPSTARWNESSLAVSSYITPSTSRWNESSFLKLLAQTRGNTAAASARRIIEWVNLKGLGIRWGSGPVMGSMAPIWNLRGQDLQYMTVWTTARIEIQFSVMSYRLPPFTDKAMRLNLLRRLNTIYGIALPEESITKYSSFHLPKLEPEFAMQSFLDTFQWVLDEYVAANP